MYIAEKWLLIAVEKAVFLLLFKKASKTKVGVTFLGKGFYVS